MNLLAKKIDRYVWHKHKKLFRGEDELFKNEAVKCTKMIEWGVGASTRWVLENTNAKLYSIENDPDWVRKVQENIQNKDIDRWQVTIVDLGHLKKWGYPKSLKNIEHFRYYSQFDFGIHGQCDLALIDGRFRVACFLNLAINCTIPMTVLFDDYLPREQYHIVENFFPVDETCGSMACFKLTPLKNESLYQAKALYEEVKNISL